MEYIGSSGVEKLPRKRCDDKELLGHFSIAVKWPWHAICNFWCRRAHMAQHTAYADNTCL